MFIECSIFGASYIQRHIYIYLITEMYYFIAQLISKANLLCGCLSFEIFFFLKNTKSKPVFPSGLKEAFMVKC